MDDAPEHEQDFPADAISALNHGQKIEAIKCVRVANNIGLKDAKDQVERYLLAHPDLRKTFDAANSVKAAGALKWMLPLMLLALAGLYWYTTNP